MTDSGRLQPFVAVTQSIDFAMPAKGNLRPLTVVHIVLGQGPLADLLAVVRPILFIWPVLTIADIDGNRQSGLRFGEKSTQTALGKVS